MQNSAKKTRIGELVWKMSLNELMRLFIVLRGKICLAEDRIRFYKLRKACIIEAFHGLSGSSLLLKIYLIP